MKLVSYNGRSSARSDVAIRVSGVYRSLCMHNGCSVRRKLTQRKMPGVHTRNGDLNLASTGTSG